MERGAQVRTKVSRFKGCGLSLTWGARTPGFSARL